MTEYAVENARTLDGGEVDIEIRGSRIDRLAPAGDGDAGSFDRDQWFDAGATVGIGHDSVMNPWYRYGVGDQLDATFVLLHYAHLSGRDDVDTLWDMLTESNAAVFGIDKYGLEEGSEGSLVVFDSPDPFNALRTRAARTLVLRNGRPIARTDPGETFVRRGEDERTVDFHR